MITEAPPKEASKSQIPRLRSQRSIGNLRASAAAPGAMPTIKPNSNIAKRSSKSVDRGAGTRTRPLWETDAYNLELPELPNKASALGSDSNGYYRRKTISFAVGGNENGKDGSRKKEKVKSPEIMQRQLSLRKRHSFVNLQALAESQKKSLAAPENMEERGRNRTSVCIERPPWNPSFHVSQKPPPMPPLNRTRTINPKFAPTPPEFIVRKRSLTPKTGLSRIPRPVTPVESVPAAAAPGSEKDDSSSTSSKRTSQTLNVNLNLGLPQWDDTMSPRSLHKKENDELIAELKKKNSMKFLHVQPKVGSFEKLNNLQKAQKHLEGPASGSTKSPKKVDLTKVKAKVGSFDKITHQPAGGNVKIETVKLDLNAVKPKVGSFEKITHQPAGGNVKIETVKLDLNAVKPKVGSFDKINHKPAGGNVKIETVKLDLNAVKPKVGSFEKVHHQPGGGNVKIETVKLDLEQVQSKVGSFEKVHHQPGGGNVKIENVRIDVENVKPRVGSFENIKHQPGGGNVKIDTLKIDLSKVPSRVGSFENICHQPGGGNVKIDNVKLNFSNIQAKIGSLDRSRPGSRTSNRSGGTPLIITSPVYSNDYIEEHPLPVSMHRSENGDSYTQVPPPVPKRSGRRQSNSKNSIHRSAESEDWAYKNELRDEAERQEMEETKLLIRQAQEDHQRC